MIRNVHINREMEFVKIILLQSKGVDLVFTYCTYLYILYILIVIE